MKYKYKYKTTKYNYEIEKIKIEKETEKTVSYKCFGKDFREAKNTYYHHYHDTLEEAVNHLIYKANNRINYAKETIIEIKKAKKKLNELIKKTKKKN